MGTRPRTLLICCGAIAREVLSIIDANGLAGFVVESLPAKLHNRPEQIPERVREKIQARRDAFDRLVVLYSDCGTGGLLQKVLDEEGVEGIGGAHCYEMFTGTAVFTALAEAELGTFYLTDYLARHFDSLIYKGLGLDRHPELQAVYFKHYKKLVYLAQRDDPELLGYAEAAARRLDLPLEVHKTGYGLYQDFLNRVQAAS